MLTNTHFSVAILVFILVGMPTETTAEELRVKDLPVPEMVKPEAAE